MFECKIEQLYVIMFLASTGNTPARVESRESRVQSPESRVQSPESRVQS